MHRLPILVVVFLILTGGFAEAAVDCQPRLLGGWEYRQAAGDGYDAEGERLVLSCLGDSMRGVYFGLEREGEHGLYYTAVEVKDLEVGASGELSFTVPERELFRERPRNLQWVKKKRLEPAGITRDELSMKGRLSDGKLIVTCTSDSASCPEASMVFQRRAVPETKRPGGGVGASGP